MDIIDAIFASLRDQGIAIPQDAKVAAEVHVRREFRGERVYVASRPKQMRAQQIAQTQKALGTAAVTLKRLAQASGIPIRSVKRLRNGR